MIEAAAIDMTMPSPLISARSRRKLGGASAITPLSGSACSLPAFLSVFLADLSRIMPGSCVSTRPGATGNRAQFPLFSAPPSPLPGLNHINAPAAAPGVRNRLQVAHSELLKRMNGRRISRIDKPEQSAAFELLEPKGERHPLPSARRKMQSASHRCRRRSDSAEQIYPLRPQRAESGAASSI